MASVIKTIDQTYLGYIIFALALALFFWIGTLSNALINQLLTFIVIGCLLLVFLIVLKRSDYIILPYILSIPVIDQTIPLIGTPGGINLSTIYKSIMMILMFLLFINHRGSLIEFKEGNIILCLIALFLSTLFLSNSYIEGMKWLGKFFHFYIAIIVIFHLVSSKLSSYRHLLIFYFYAVVIISFSILSAIIFDVGGPAAVAYGEGAISGNFKTHIAIILSISFPMIMLMPNILKRRGRYYYIIAALMIICVIFVFQRTAFVILLLESIIIYIMSAKIFNRKQRLITTISFVVLIAIASYIYYINIPLVQKRLSDLIGHRREIGIYEMGSGRYGLYAELLREFKNRSALEKIVGSGMNSTLEYIPTYAHSFALRLLIEGGIVALILYFMFLYRIMQLLIFRLKRGDYIYGTLGICFLLATIIVTAVGESLFFSSMYHVFASILLAGIKYGVKL